MWCSLNFFVVSGVTWQQFPPGHGGSSMAVILDKCKTSVFGLVSSAWINNDIHDTICHLLHLCQDLFSLFGLWNAAHKKATVVYTCTHTKKSSIPVWSRVRIVHQFLWLCFVYKMSSLNNTSPDFIVVELFHGILSLLFCGEGNKCIASIVAIEVHHHPYFVNFAKLQRQ